MRENPSTLLGRLARETARIHVVDRALFTSVHPAFPAEYETGESGAVAELVALLTVDEDAEPFCCMCHGDVHLGLYDSSGRSLHDFQLHRPSGLGSRSWEGQLPLVQAPGLVRLLDPADPGGLCARQRRAWAVAAPAAILDYAAAWADGTIATAADDTRALAALAAAYSRPHASRARALLGWLGTGLPGHDAARLLHALVPARLLAALPPAEISDALLTPYSPTRELHGAVAYFTSDTFTSRHPKKRRLAAAARTLLLDFARRFHPDQVRLLERRVLQDG